MDEDDDNTGYTSIGSTVIGNDNNDTSMNLQLFLNSFLVNNNQFPPDGQESIISIPENQELDITQNLSDNVTRTLFQRILLTHLVTPEYIEFTALHNSYNDLVDIPDDFWEPVKVNLPEYYIDNFEYIKNENISECFICAQNVYNIYILPCCDKDMCKECVYRWFGESVFCPYCKADIRDCYYPISEQE